MQGGSHTLVRIMAAPSEMRRSASPRLRQPHTKGALKLCLLMWCASSAGVSTCAMRMREHMAMQTMGWRREEPGGAAAGQPHARMQ